MVDSRVAYFFLSFLVVFTAQGQGIDIVQLSKGGSVSADANVFNVGDETVFDGDSSFGLTPADFPVMVDLSADAAFMGCTSSADVMYTATFVQSGDDLSGSVVGTSSASGASGPTENAFAITTTGAGQSYVFEFTEGEATLTANGTISTTASILSGQNIANARFQLLRSTGGPSEEVINIRAFSPPALEIGIGEQETINVDMTLEPGRYTITIGGGAKANTDTVDPVVSSSAMYDVAFNVSYSSSGGGGGLVFWEAGSGAWETDTNWEPEGVPTSSDIAIFDRDAIYTVTLQNPEVGQVIVERGAPLFDGTTLMLSGGSVDTPSLIVGNTSVDEAQLELFVGDVSSFGTVIGSSANTRGRLNIDGATSWADGGEVVVGAQGRGVLSIDDGTDVTVARITLGQSSSGNGEVTMINPLARKGSTPQFASAQQTIIGENGTGLFTIANANIATERTVLGENAGSNGSVTIQESGDFSQWVFNQEFIVGERGIGTFEAFDGTFLQAPMGVATPVYIAKEAGSVGTLRLEGSLAILNTSGGSIFVGEGGDGSLVLEGGAFLSAGKLSIGPSQDKSTKGAAARGDAVFVGSGVGSIEPDADLVGDLNVGVLGEGELTLSAEYWLECTRANFASEGGGDARALISESILEATDRVIIGSEMNNGTAVVTMQDGLIEAPIFVVEAGSSVRGTGTILYTIAGSIEGEVSAEVDRLQGKGPSASGLNFTGDTTFAGATIRVEVRGPGNVGGITIDGTADITNATIQIDFVGGYVPMQGDELTFLTATGGLTIDNNTMLAFTGVADGFLFAVSPEGNGLVFEALNDAGPDPFPYDVNGDMATNSIDVQLVINKALGADIGDFDADLNFDGSVNAIDIQTSINAVLGVG